MNLFDTLIILTGFLLLFTFALNTVIIALKFKEKNYSHLSNILVLALCVAHGLTMWKNILYLLFFERMDIWLMLFEVWAVIAAISFNQLIGLKRKE